MLRRLPTILVNVVVLLGLGCDDPAPTRPPDVSDAPSTQPTPQAEAPTTQELLAMPRRTLALTPNPFTVQAPPSWDYKATAQGQNVLTGPAPSGTVQILFTARDATTADKLDRMLKAATRDYEARKKDFTRFSIRDVGRMKIFESLEIVEGADPGAAPDKPKPRYIVWSVRYFVSQGTKSDVYELSLYGLTAEQYEMDREFLDSLVGSIALSAGDNLLK